MIEEISLLKPGWKFFFRNDQGSEIVSKIKIAQEKNPSSIRLLKTTTGRRRIYVFEPEGSTEKFLIKAYLPAKISKRLKYLLRNSRCKQEFEASQKLKELGIPAVNAIAFGYRLDKGMPAEEIVIEPFVEDAQPFNQVWKTLAFEQRKNLFKALAKMLAYLHKTGVLQRDFKPDSILVRKIAQEYELILSDLERIKLFRKNLSQNQRIDNLGKIIQAFFSLLPCPEMDWLIDEYATESGIPFNQPEKKIKIFLKAKKHLLKLAEQRKSWANNTNELIEKFEIQDMEIRVSKDIGKKAIEKFLEKNQLPHKGLIEISGKKMEIKETRSAKAVMENYFYLRELKIKCPPALLAVDYTKKNRGLVGLQISESEKTYQQMLQELPSEEKHKLESAYNDFISRLKFLELALNNEQLQKILVAKVPDGYEFSLPSPEKII